MKVTAPGAMTFALSGTSSVPAGISSTTATTYKIVHTGTLAITSSDTNATWTCDSTAPGTSTCTSGQITPKPSVTKASLVAPCPIKSKGILNDQVDPAWSYYNCANSTVPVSQKGATTTIAITGGASGNPISVATVKSVAQVQQWDQSLGTCKVVATTKTLKVDPSVTGNGHTVQCKGGFGALPFPGGITVRGGDPASATDPLGQLHSTDTAMFNALLG